MAGNPALPITGSSSMPNSSTPNNGAARTGPAYLLPETSPNRPMALGNPGGGRPADSDATANYTADLRSSPTADYRTSRVENRDYRNELRGEYPGTGYPQGNPLMPSPAASNSHEPERSEPGVARFEGTIESPR